MCDICSLSWHRVEAFYAGKEVLPICDEGAASLKAELQIRLDDVFRRLSRAFPDEVAALALEKAEHTAALRELAEKLEVAKERYRRVGSWPL